MMSLVMGGWGKIATAVVGIATFLASMLGWRHGIRKKARLEIENAQQRNTLERIKIKEKMAAQVNGMSDGDVLERLRDKGYLRD